MIHFGIQALLYFPGITLCGRSVEEREEYQRVSTNVEKGLSVIQEELHRMRMATKAQVDSIAIEREVRSQSPFTQFPH